MWPTYIIFIFQDTATPNILHTLQVMLFFILLTVLHIRVEYDHIQRGEAIGLWNAIKQAFTTNQVNPDPEGNAIAGEYKFSFEWQNIMQNIKLHFSQVKVSQTGLVLTAKI